MPAGPVSTAAPGLFPGFRLMQTLGNEEVRLDAIRMPQRLRRVDEAWVEALAASIERNGLQQPIQVACGPDGGFRLVAGAHRYAAVQWLGRDTIAAQVIDVTDDEARLLEIDENLFRRELSYYDRAKFLAERQAVWERLHPETKRGVAGGKARQRKEGAPATAMIAFAGSAAERVGLSERSIQEAVKLWRDLSDETKHLVENSPSLADNGAFLKRIAALPRAEQLGAVQAHLSPAGEQPESDPVQAQFERLIKAWGRAGEKARAQFLRHVEPQ